MPATRLFLLLLLASGCIREVRRVVPVAVYGETRHVSETHDETPAPPDVLASTSGKIAVLDFTGASGEGAAVSSSLRRGLDTRLSGDAIAPDRCGGRGPCFEIVTEEMPAVSSSPPAEGASLEPIEPALAAIGDRAEHVVLGELAEGDGATHVTLVIVEVAARRVVWRREADVADLAALADLVARAFAVPATPAPVHTVRTVEVRRGVVGIERREVTAYEFTGRFSFQSEVMTRLAPFESSLEPAVAFGIVFGGGPVYHRFHVGGAITKQVANADCESTDFGGGAFFRYGLHWAISEYVYLGGQVGAGVHVLDSVSCPAGDDRFYIDGATIGAAAGFRFGVLELGVLLRGAYGVASPSDDFSASFLVGPQITIESE
jgi:hypothetical protein